MEYKVIEADVPAHILEERLKRLVAHDWKVVAVNNRHIFLEREEDAHHPFYDMPSTPMKEK